LQVLRTDSNKMRYYLRLKLKFMNKYSLGFILFAYSIVGQCGDLPNAKMTPGALNLQVTQENIHETVCVKGFTKTIRPPANYTNKLKRQ
jgi:hypothetical protein